MCDDDDMTAHDHLDLDRYAGSWNVGRKLERAGSVTQEGRRGILTWLPHTQ